MSSGHSYIALVVIILAAALLLLFLVFLPSGKDTPPTSDENNIATRDGLTEPYESDPRVDGESEDGTPTDGVDSEIGGDREPGPPANGGDDIPETGLFGGRIFLNIEGSLAGIKVEIVDAATKKVVAVVETDENGAFEVNLPPGSYYSRLITEKLLAGYRPAWKGLRIESGRESRWDTSPQPAPQTNSCIFGRVRDYLSGEPMSGVGINVNPIIGMSREDLIDKFGFGTFARVGTETDGRLSPASATTDYDGNYRIDLVPGYYKLTINEPGYFKSEKLIAMRMYSERHDDFYLTPCANISGYVTDSATGLPIEDAFVRLGGGRKRTDANGYYSFLVRVGKHDLICLKDGYREIGRVAGNVIEVEVPHEDIEYDIELDPIVNAITGRITQKGGTALDVPDLMAAHGPLKLSVGIFTIPGPRHELLDESYPRGEFIMKNVTFARTWKYPGGEYKIDAAAGEYYVRAVLPGKYKPSISDKVVLEEGGATRVDFELEPEGVPATIRGKLIDADTGKPIKPFTPKGDREQLEVSFIGVEYLYGESGEKKGWFPNNSVRHAKLDDSGGFTASIPSGRWLVGFPSNQCRRIGTYGGFYTMIELAPGEVRVIDIPIVKIPPFSATLKFQCYADGELRAQMDAAGVYIHAYYRGALVERRSYGFNLDSRYEDGWRKWDLPAGKVKLIAQTMNGEYISEPVIVRLESRGQGTEPQRTILELAPAVEDE